MEQLMALMVLVALLGLCSVAAAVAVAVLVVRRVVVAAGAGADRVRLRAASYGAGPAAEAARLRLALRREMDAAGRAVAVARARGWPLGDAPALVGRLERVAADVDARLQAVAVEPRRDVAARELALVRGEADTVGCSAAGLREALLSSGRAVDAGEVSALAADCAIEAGALRAH